MIDKETGKTVAGFDDWTKRVRELNQLAKDGKNDEVIAKGRAIEGFIPITWKPATFTRSSPKPA